MILQIDFHFIFSILLSFLIVFYYYKMNAGAGREILYALSSFQNLMSVFMI